MITPTTEQLENSLRWWIAMGSGLKSKYCQPQNSGNPAPNVPYATLLFISDSQPGKPVQKRVLDGSGDIDETVLAVVNGRYSIQWYRDGAEDMASRFRVWAYSSAGRYATTSGRSVLPPQPPMTSVSSYPATERYHGLPMRGVLGDEPTLFAPFAMMRLTDPQRIDAIISDDEEPRYTSTLDIQYVQVFDDTLQRFVEADIILSDGFSPEVTIEVREP